MNLDDDRELWRYQPPIGRDGRYISDFYDEWARKKLWPDTFGRAYNKEIEENMTDDVINPKHYKDIIPGFQYIQLMEHLLKGKTGVEAHLLGQIYKYSMRLGNKDSLEQDSSKIAWYACCLRDYYKTGSIPKN